MCVCILYVCQARLCTYENSLVAIGDLFQCKRFPEWEVEDDLKEGEVWIMLERKQWIPSPRSQRILLESRWIQSLINNWAGRCLSCVCGVMALQVGWMIPVACLSSTFRGAISDGGDVAPQGSPFWCFIVFAVVLTFCKWILSLPEISFFFGGGRVRGVFCLCFLILNHLIIAVFPCRLHLLDFCWCLDFFSLAPLLSWNGYSAYLKPYWPCREQGSYSACFAGCIHCLSIPALCFLFSQQQSRVDSDLVTPKCASGELLFSHMLPVFEQLSAPTSLYTCPCLILPHSFLSVCLICQEHLDHLPSGLCYCEMCWTLYKPACYSFALPWF